MGRRTPPRTVRMRDKRFDALTQHLGDGPTRRRLLLALIEVASGVPPGRAAAAAPGADAGERGPAGQLPDTARRTLRRLPRPR